MIHIQPEVIGAFATGVLGPAIVVYLKYVLDNKKKKNEIKCPISESIKCNLLINNKISEILDTYGADRVWVNQFHNGGNFYPTGKSIHKFSICYEAVSKGTTSIKEQFQNIPVSLFAQSMNHLLENDVIKLYDIKNEIETFGLRAISSESGTKSGYLFAIKSIDNKFIGVLGIDYTKRKRTLTEEDINQLHIETTTIGGVLMKNNIER